MTTKSQEAFEIAMSASMEKHEREICKIAWREGEAYGRKQALEEAIAEVQVFECGGTNVQAAAINIGKALKELIK
jgi:hypothetical protein